MTPASSGARLAGSQVKALNCPGCGGALTIRGFEHTLTVVCPQCLAILDAKDPNLQVLQKFNEKTRVKLQIPLGSRGSWRGTVYEVIGYQQRTITAGGERYSWSEYLLFNPYKGFRYLTEYNGHWNYVRTLRSLPRPGLSLGSKPRIQFGGSTFTHFSTAQAVTTYVLGEFPWQVKRGESVAARDYVSPPMILSSESTPSETVWSLGEYIGAEEIWKAFKLQGAPPKPAGVFCNQPSPLVAKSRELWRLFGLFFVAACVLVMAAYLFSSGKQVFSDNYHFSRGAKTETSFVTPVFTLEGRTSNVELTTKTDLGNSWAYFNYALINDETGQVWDFGREVSYYFGRDSDGSWSEGSREDDVTLSNIPSGRYYLRVEPELDPALSRLEYSVAVRRGVAVPGWFWLIAFLLFIPPAITAFRRFSFERRRWAESDYAPVSSGDD
ncbi:MAG TPA: DUF4178 domain-containing protein [Bryobacteraceae bacterium]|jgi:hypothetical protein|nr:DUF4178 domain-containing protein [Bryobacteraceae bacterium]